MSRYYFHVSGEKTFNDYRGQEFPDDQTAMAEAHSYAVMISRGGAHGGSSVRVTDESGREVGEIKLD